jgi:hypothetical protein
MKIGLVLLVGGMLAGCTALPPLPNMAEASDPAYRAAPLAYAPVTGGYVARRPAEPGDWRQMNERVAPRGAFE